MSEEKVSDKIVIMISIIALIFCYIITLNALYDKGYNDGLKDICKDFDIVLNTNDNKVYCAEKINKTNPYDKFVIPNNEAVLK